MAKIDEYRELANKIAELLKGQDDMEITHNDCGTLVEIDNVSFSYDADGNGEGITIAL